MKIGLLDVELDLMKESMELTDHSEGLAQKKILEVSCAIIEKHGQVLAAQRNRNSSMGGYWEFPGGKIEMGESPSDSLIRELKEEMGVRIHIFKALEPSLTEEKDQAIRLHPFRCFLPGEYPFPREHLQILWVHPDRLGALNWAPADIPVLGQYLQSLESGS